ncbi:gastrula zinc finger protein XlCGF7.1-like [Corythoichthys intestinalis]|uniref:gastrula zinc finger protein XlCGF7.1-like n=1 Tax=Corythoichthys intestinalis TaxID=161448 RepID=UPI0025A5F085|nr:gastrula zinc finger protein XlCGF7.1-like [Corythoichthys intestinalis]
MSADWKNFDVSKKDAQIALEEIGQSTHKQSRAIKAGKEDGTLVWLLKLAVLCSWRRWQKITREAAAFRKYLVAERKEPEYPGVKQEDVELPQIKEEEPEPSQQEEREEKLPIKKEEEELPYVKEEEGISRSTGEPLKSEDGPSEASKGVEPPSCGSSSSSTERLQPDIFIAPPDRNGATSHSPYNNDGHKKSHCDNKLCKCSQCGKTFAEQYCCRRHMRNHTDEKCFSCSVCGQRFCQKSAFNTHSRTHTGEKPFS